MTITQTADGRPAAIYTRISQDRTGAGLGVARQREVCEKFAADRGLSIAQVFTDNDMSAYSGKPRPGYRAMLDGIEAGRFGAVIAWHADRLHRSPLELEDYITATEAAGTPTYSATGGTLDLSTPAGRLQARIAGAVARSESEHRGERITAKHVQAARDGRWRGGATRPFGYRLDKDAPGGLVVDDTEVDLIRGAYARVLAGDSLGAIIRDWNAAGVQTTGKAAKWSYATLRQLLRRPMNYGASVHNGLVVGEGRWPALVDEATWRRVDALLSAPGRRRSTSNVGRHLMAGLLRCGRCGSTMRSMNGRTRAGTVLPNYVCKSGDHYLSRQIDHVDKFVTALLLARIGRADAADLLVPPMPADVSAALKDELAALRKRDQDDYRLYLHRVLTADEFAEARRSVRARIVEVEARLSDPGQVEALGELVAAADPVAVWETMGWRRRRQAIAAVLTVTALPIPKGAPRRFDPAFLQVEWIR